MRDRKFSTITKPLKNKRWIVHAKSIKAVCISYMMILEIFQERFSIQKLDKNIRTQILGIPKKIVII